MSASNPVSSSNAGGYEPSMEEILASIRRIIADDQSIPKAVAAEALPRADAEVAPAPPPIHRFHLEPASPAEIEPATLEPMLPKSIPPKSILSRSIGPEPAAPQQAVSQDTAPVAMPSQGTIAAPQYPMPDSIPAAEAPTPAYRPEAEVAAPASESRTEAPPASFSPKAKGLFSSDTNKSVSSAFNALAVSRLADNSEELMAIARDMIRPLLRSWIDDNLPTMVERMVRDEIERVARGG